MAKSTKSTNRIYTGYWVERTQLSELTAGYSTWPITVHPHSTVKAHEYSIIFTHIYIYIDSLTVDRRLEAIAIGLEAIGIRLDDIAFWLEAIAIRLDDIAIRLEAIAIRLDDIAIRLEAIAIRLDDIAIRLEAIATIVWMTSLSQVGGHRY